MAEGADKRETKRFEPPPWERDRFDALDERRRAEEAARQEAPEAAEQPGGTGSTAGAPEPGPAVAPGASPEASPEAAGAESAPAAAAEGESAAPATSAPADAQVDAMLMQLRAEEPSVEADTKWVGLGSGTALMLIGVSMLVWGLIGFIRTKGVISGAVGALILLVIGGLFAVTGMWVAARATK